jgi:hypothetical protein
VDSSLQPSFMVIVHNSCGVKRFSKQFANTFAFSNGKNAGPKGPGNTVGALVHPLCEGLRSRPYCLRCDLTVSILVSHRSSALFRVILLKVLVTQFTAVLYARSRVCCHNFLSVCLCFSSRPTPDGLGFRSEILVILVDNLYAGAI